MGIYPPPLGNLLNNSTELQNRIVLEDTPSNHKFLAEVLNAMRDNKMLRISYKEDAMTEYRDMVVHPYCIRLFKRRWYLIGYSEYSKDIRMYMLDKTASARILSENFEMPQDFDAEGYFEEYYGADKNYGEKERVVVKAFSTICDLIRTVPLHHSQKEVETTSEFSVFEYFLRPNLEFKQEIISYLDSVEILEPLTLRQDIGKTMFNIYIKYREDIRK